MSEVEKEQENFRKIIAQAKSEKRKELDLSGHTTGEILEEIPDEVFELSHLEKLGLFGQRIREVPERIRDLTNLKHLSLIRNPVEKVPDIPGLELDWVGYLRCRKTLSKQNVGVLWIDIDTEGALRREQGKEPQFLSEITLLTNLRTLNVGWETDVLSTLSKASEEVNALLDKIAELQSLETLYLHRLLIGNIPDGIRSLKKLRSLQLYGAELEKIPAWVGELSGLRHLGFMGSKLTTLPNSLATLHELESLDVSGNLFTEIPEVVFRLRSLRYLNIGAYTHTEKGLIKQIPADVLLLPNLNTLDVRGQPIEVPPPEVVEQGVAAIKKYWRQQQEVGVDYLAEAKLIIVGEAGAGKTSLAKKIEDPAYELKPQEVSTEGIDVIRWGFPCAVRVKKEGREELHQTDFRVSIWDFGGQEIYHATHQFFLTRRSLYLLVADDRKEDTDFNYWLQVVELRSDRSPLLIVQNEKQDRQRPLDLGALRARFPNLREALRVNLADNRGLDGLVKTIREELERLPHIGTPLPKTWSQVRAALEGDPRNYISLDEFLDICQQNGFKRREDKLQLSGYLHDLGICLHFQEDDVLKNTVILKPKWGTDAVYSVLDDRGVLERRGRFGPEDLARIWADEKYADMRGELLRLMMRFQLCYQLPDRPVYIAPQLLSPTRPAYEWKGRNELVLRYDYEFMPKGILTRFIVAVNHLIADQGLVWKSGVILARDGSRAEVIEDYPLRKINVRVTGADSRGLLAIVDDQLERIHASFPRLKYEKFLPCNCEVCRERDEPFAYPLTELKDFAAQGDKIQCRVSRKLVDAAELLRDVLPWTDHLLEAFVNQYDIPRQETYRPAESPSVKEVFVSYAWSGESGAVVDKLQESFEGRDITLVRDKNEMRYMDSIRDFMQRIGRGKCVVVVLSKRYLESKNCMFELTEIAGRGDIRDRVFPIVLDDAKIYDAMDRLEYIEYWERKREALDAKMKKVGGENLQGIREELDLFSDIRNTIARIVDILSDMNTLTPEQHRGSDFGALLQALESRLSE